MDLKLSGRVAVITGASKGIGLACANALGEEGARLVIISRGETDLLAAAAKLRQTGADPLIRVCDLRDSGAVTTMVTDVENQLGPVDILVNCAGAASRTRADELTVEGYRQAMEAKYFTYVNAIEAVIHRMEQRGHGAIVNVIGTSGKVASELHVAAGAANAALMLVTVALAKAYAQRGVRINAVNPGTVMTVRMEERVRVSAETAGISTDEALRTLLEAIPIGRAANATEVARVVAFLASDAASYVTGTIVPIDGGATAAI